MIFTCSTHYYPFFHWFSFYEFLCISAFFERDLSARITRFAFEFAVPAHPPAYCAICVYLLALLYLSECLHASLPYHLFAPFNFPALLLVSCLSIDSFSPFCLKFPPSFCVAFSPFHLLIKHSTQTDNSHKWNWKRRGIGKNTARLSIIKLQSASKIGPEINLPTELMIFAATGSRIYLHCLYSVFDQFVCQSLFMQILTLYQLSWGIPRSWFVMTSLDVQICVLSLPLRCSFSASIHSKPLFIIAFLLPSFLSSASAQSRSFIPCGKECHSAVCSQTILRNSNRKRK